MFDAIQLTLFKCTLNFCIDRSIWHFKFPKVDGRLKINTKSKISINLEQITLKKTYLRWSGHFRHSFVNGLCPDHPSNFYWNRFIFGRQGAKDKLAQFFFGDTVYISFWTTFLPLYGEDYYCIQRWRCCIFTRLPRNQPIIIIIIRLLGLKQHNQNSKHTKNINGRLYINLKM